MPTIAELVNAKLKRPVMKHDGNITLVDDDRALAVAANHHGQKRAEVFVGPRVWKTDTGLELRG